MPDILVDSSFLYALFQKDDKHHRQAKEFAAGSRLPALVPDVVLPEVTFLLVRDGGVHAAAAFLEGFKAASLKLECLTIEDISRAREIMLNYADARFDFVDCVIMSMAERFTITQICTFDRRDFSIYRPTHSEYLELLP
jgi:predicted nucleic acid-binding protein